MQFIRKYFNYGDLSKYLTEIGINKDELEISYPSDTRNYTVYLSNENDIKKIPKKWNGTYVSCRRLMKEKEEISSPIKVEFLSREVFIKEQLIGFNFYVFFIKTEIS